MAGFGENDKPVEDSSGGFSPNDKPASGFLRRAVADPALALAKGVIGVPEAAVGLADIATGGAAGRAAEGLGFRPKEAKQILTDMQSPELAAAKQRVSEARGFFPTAAAAVANPSTIVDTAVESVPSMGVGGVIGRGAIALAPKLSPVVAGAIGEGAVSAAQTAEQVRQEDPNGALTPGQAAIAAGSGALTGAIGFGAGRVANRLGIGDVETDLVRGKFGPVGEQAVQQGAQKGIARKAAEGFASEGLLEEAPQSFQEQVAQNLMQGKDPTEGAAEAAAQGMLAGGITGGAVAPLHSAAAAPAAAPTPTLALPNSPDPLIVAPDGTVARRSEIEAYISGLPEDQQLAARAKLQGFAPQPADAPPPAPLLALPPPTVTVDSAGNARAPGQMAPQSEPGPIETGAFGQGRNSEIQFIPPAGQLALPPPTVTVDANGVAIAPGQNVQTQPAAPAVPLETGNFGRGRNSEPVPAPAVGTPAADLLARQGDPMQSAVRARIDRQEGHLAAETDTASSRRAQFDSIFGVADSQNQTAAGRGERARAVAAAADLQGPNAMQMAMQRARQSKSQAMGLDSNAGPLSAAAVIAVDNGAHESSTRASATSAGNFPTALAARRALTQSGQQGEVVRSDGGWSIKTAEQQAAQSPAAQQAQPEAAQAGNGLQPFPAGVGSLGVPRAQMPQITPTTHGPLTQFLAARGITHETGTVDPAALKPTQAEYSPEKVRQQRDDGAARTLLVSSDGYLLDGHHQWLSRVNAGQPVKAIKFNAPIQQLLQLAREFPSSTTDTQAAAGETKGSDAETKAAQPAAARAAADTAAAPASQAPAGTAAPGGTDRPAAGNAGGQPLAAVGATDGQRPAQGAGGGGSRPAPVERSADRAQPQVVRSEAAGAVAGAAGGDAGQKPVAPKPLSVGSTPQNAEPVTVRNGVVHIGKYPALNYDTGEDVRAPAGATDAQIKQALKDAGSLTSKQKFFGGEKEDAAPSASQDQPAVADKPAATPLQAKVQAASTKAEKPAKAAPAHRLDHGELNIPGRTSTINAELDKFKAQQAKQQRADAKAKSKARVADKAQARKLFDELWPAMKEKMGARFGEKQLRETLDSMVKWEPTKFIELAQKFQREQGDGAMFSRGADAQMRRGPDASTGQQLRLTAIDRELSRLTRDWLRKPDLHVIASMAEAPDPVRRVWEQQNSEGASGDIEGFHWRGSVYIVADAVATREDVRRVLFHESLGHFGLRGVFGDRLNPMLDQLATMRPQLIAKKAQQYGLNLANESERRMAAEEVLAEMAQTRPEIGWVRRTIAAIRTWLREHGITKGLSDDEIVRNYILPARGWVERGRSAQPSSASKPAAFARAADAAAANQDGSDAMFSRAAAHENTFGTLTPEQEQALKNVGGIRAKETIAERFARLRANLGVKVMQGLFDQFAPIKSIGQREYMLARMSKGAEGTLEAALMYGKPFLRDGVADVNVQDGGFAKVLGTLHGEHDRFLWWVAAQRAARLKAEGRENLFTDADISHLRTLNAGTFDDGTSRAATYAAALRELNAFNEAALKLAMDSGLIDQDAFEAMRYDAYVPFYRLIEDGDELPRFRGGSGLVNQEAFKKLKGGKDKLNTDLLQNLLLNWSHLYAAAAKNRAAQATIEQAMNLAIAYPAPGGGKGTVKVKEGGRDVAYRVEDPYLLEAITALTYVPSPLIKPLAGFKHLLTLGVTANPAFKIRNLMRDSIAAAAQADLSYNPLENVVKGWKATSRDSQTYASMLASGGIIRFGTQEDSSRARKQIQAMGGEVLDTNGWKKLTGQMAELWDAYQEFGDRGENVNRAALYEKLVAQGKSHAEAAFMARDLMDFSMGGSWGAVRFLAQTVPFLNARLIGLQRLGQAAKENPKRFLAVTGAVALASLALMSAYSDDDDWKRREDWDRDAYWWFKIGGTAFRIPKPFEIGAIGTLAERTAELMMSDEMTGKRFGQRLSAMLFQTFNFDPTPQAFKPMLDVYSNKDSFTGRPIESMSVQRLRPQDRIGPRTSEIARLLGQMGLPDPVQLAKGEYTPLSPKQADSLLRAYFGWFGTVAQTVSDYAIRPMMDRGERPAMQMRDVFLLGNFAETLPTGSSRYVTTLYEQAKEIEQAYASYHAALKAGDTDKALAILESEGPKIRSFQQVVHIKRAESQINAQIRRIEESRELSAEEKRGQIEVLQRRREQIARPLTARLPQ